MDIAAVSSTNLNTQFTEQRQPQEETAGSIALFTPAAETTGTVASSGFSCMA